MRLPPFAAILALSIFCLPPARAAEEQDLVVPAAEAEPPRSGREFSATELAARPANYQPSDKPYDWTKTKMPERPYFHKYDRTLVTRLLLAEKGPENECKVNMKFEQALKVIQRLDGNTAGAPKIVYLVGWQSIGSDSKSPDWSEVNHHLKRPDDKTALDSLRWLITEARTKYHTIVSLQVNMSDAYENSPAWDLYLEKGVVAKNKDGTKVKGDLIGGEQAYRLSYAKEWETGLAKKRIDALLKMLPELGKNCHTICIDGFNTRPLESAEPASIANTPILPSDDEPSSGGISPASGYTHAQEAAAQRKTLRYFRDHQIDVVCDQSTNGRVDPFTGLQPMAFNYIPPAKGIPSRLYCGSQMDVMDKLKGEEYDWVGVREQLAFKALPLMYANMVRAKKIGTPEEGRKLTKLEWSKLYDGGDCFCTMPWWPRGIMAYSIKGYTTARSWEIPKEWGGKKDVHFVNVSRITVSGKSVKLERLQVNHGTPTDTDKIYLQMDPGEMYLLLPGNN